MKKAIALLVLILIAAVVVYELMPKQETKPNELKEPPLSISKNSDRFNKSFGALMSNYYGVQRALVDWDTAQANRAALLVLKSADSLPLTELKADSSIVATAQNLVMGMDGEVKGIIGETSIDQKRRGFNMLTDLLYSLVRTVRYDRETIYHIRCPMAFGDSTEGFWLSNSAAIVNPYLGKNHPTYKSKMLGCGEIVDSLDFAHK